MSELAVSAAQESDELALQLVEEQRDRLLGKLRRQRLLSAELWSWYRGDQPVPAVDRNYTQAYRLFLELSRTPWARLVVDTIAERLHVQGFHAGVPAGGAAEEQSAWSIFQGAGMDADEWLIYTEALITGCGYLSVSEGEEPGTVAIVPESGFEVTHEHSPESRRQLSAALKLFPADWTGLLWVCELYRSEGTYRWVLELTEPPAKDGLVFPIDSVASKPAQLAWEPAEQFATPNQLGQILVVPFENRATILGGGMSELGDCLPILRRIDKLTLDKMLTSESAAFRQRWATGLEVPRGEDGQPIEPYKAAVSKLWVSEAPETKFGSFEASDLTQYLKAIDAEIAALAAISRVPAHYLLQSNLANPPSAESLVAAESGLVAKVRERQRRFGEAWERALRLGFAISGETDWARTCTWRWRGQTLKCETRRRCRTLPSSCKPSACRKRRCGNTSALRRSKSPSGRYRQPLPS